MKLSANTPVSQILLYVLIAACLVMSLGLAFQLSFLKPALPYFFLLACFVFFIFQPVNDLRFLAAMAGVMLMVFGLELLALKTGWVFGHYRFGYGLGSKLYGVSWVFVLSWAVLTGASVMVISSHVDNRWATALLAALLVVLVYFLAERSVGSLNFWYVKNGSLHAYLGRFAASAFIAFCFGPVLKSGDARSGWTFIGLLVFFFGVLAIAREL